MNKQEFFETLIARENSTKQKLFYSAIFLFSQKGYANVGIRELCRSVNVKESAFYNHYAGKEELFRKILDDFVARGEQVVYTDEEIQATVSTGNVRAFFEQNMRRFTQAAGDPLYHTVLQIVIMESFTNPQAKAIARHNLYYVRRDYTEKVLQGMLENGFIRGCDPAAVTAEYYYGLKGMLDEYLLVETWNEDLTPIRRRISDHIDFYVCLLQK
jgi:AcrR family transcriptional regulator